MRNGFYPKLAAQGMRKNYRFFLPYLLALAGLTAAFYVMSALSADPGVAEMRGFEYVQLMMQLGLLVAGVLSAVLMLYINSFLMKQRKRELGLYNILGMGKGNIALLLCWESLYTAILGIGGGLVLGVLFHKLATIALTALLKFSVPFHSSLSPSALLAAAGFFLALLVLCLVLNLCRLGFLRPIELLHGGNVGEKEPKTRWLLAVAGLTALGAGYFIAVTTKDPAMAMLLYFLAVLLVILGTYCLFTAGSVALLKALRRNKGYYYQTGHFIGVSGMLYRMKRNAVGLATICILSTMVMVMLSGTLALYLGQGEIIAARYPASLNITIGFDPMTQAPDPVGMERLVRDFAAEHDVPVTNLRLGQYLQFGVSELRGDEFSGAKPGFLTSTTQDNNANRTLFVLTTEDYEGLSGQSAPTLAPGELAVCGPGPAPGPLNFTDCFDYDNTLPFTVKETLPSLPMFSVTTNMTEPVCLVTADETGCTALRDFVGPDVTRNSLVLLDLDCTNDRELALLDAWYDASMDEGFFDGTGTWETWNVDSRAEMAVDGYSMAGGFLFLGLVLGIVFLMATVLIIYYKQVSEGYEDRGRFEIMRKVGLSQREVKSSIRSQVLIVFLLPIAAAAVHILFDFNLVARMLTMFGVRNLVTVVLCTVGTLAAFLLVYALVYLRTAKTYYRIVQ